MKDNSRAAAGTLIDAGFRPTRIECHRVKDEAEGELLAAWHNEIAKVMWAHPAASPYPKASPYPPLFPYVFLIS